MGAHQSFGNAHRGRGIFLPVDEHLVGQGLIARQDDATLSGSEGISSHADDTIVPGRSSAAIGSFFEYEAGPYLRDQGFGCAVKATMSGRVRFRCRMELTTHSGEVVPAEFLASDPGGGRPGLR